MMQEQPESIKLPFSIAGTVVHGQQLGRQLGFPTANIKISEGKPFALNHGVYAVFAEVDNIRYSGIANAGIRPTIGGRQFQLEVHLFDFLDDIYGRSIRVTFIHFIRPEKRFSSPEELVVQIGKDIEEAKKVIFRAALKP